MLVYERHYLFGGRPGPAAKKTGAALSIALARLSSAFSRRRRLSSSAGPAVIPALGPLPVSAWRDHVSTVPEHLTPNRPGGVLGRGLPRLVLGERAVEQINSLTPDLPGVAAGA